jgi:maltose 6'-phosphate phosphatase
VLNLHCYQENHQTAKLIQIATAIEQEAVDVVCFQEVAEEWNNGHGDWASNAAHRINQLLKQPMQLYYDWSHLGFDRYREGVAILSRLPLQQVQSRYVSDDNHPHNIHARKVVMARLQLPWLGELAVFSVHLSWWNHGFSQQLTALMAWANELVDSGCKVLLAGDFNVEAGSQGYQQVTHHYGYTDHYLQANHAGLNDARYRVNDAVWQQLLSQDYRIDYLFSHPTAGMRAVAARVLFTEHDYGAVSDHCGYLFTLEPE